MYITYFLCSDVTRSRTPSPNNAKASMTETRENPKNENVEENVIDKKGGDAPSHADIMSRYKRLVTARSQASATSEAITTGEALETNTGENESEFSDCQQTIGGEETTEVSEPEVISTSDGVEERTEKEEEEEEETEKGELSCLSNI